MLYSQSCKTCEGCLWFGLCGPDQRGADDTCDDYTPVDGNEDVDTYGYDLLRRRDAYQEIIDEYSDGTSLSDEW